MTNHDTAALAPAQLVAIEALAAGNSVTEAARACGAARQTVSGWLNRDHLFQAALNLKRQELWAENSDRLRALVAKALEALEQGLSGAKSVDAVAHILRAAGIYGTPRPIGPIHPEEFEREEAERKRDLLIDNLILGMSR